MRHFGCGKTFDRIGDERLCPECLTRLAAVPLTVKNVSAHLAAFGLYEARNVSMGTGQHIGPTRLKVWEVYGEDDHAFDTLSMSIFWTADTFFHRWQRLTTAERREVLQAFVDASPAAVGRGIGVHRATIHRFQARVREVLNPRPALVKARECLGMTSEELIENIAHDVQVLFWLAAQVPAQSAKHKADVQAEAAGALFELAPVDDWVPIAA